MVPLPTPSLTLQMRQNDKKFIILLFLYMEFVFESHYDEVVIDKGGHVYVKKWFKTRHCRP